MKEITIYNTVKGRLETIKFDFTSENTTWFADAVGGLLIQKSGYTYPVLIGDVSRSDIGNNQQKALALLHQQM